jgi:hypothetical protein
VSLSSFSDPDGSQRRIRGLERGPDILTIDVRDTDLVLTMPHRRGVAHMLVALEDAGLGVSRIEPRIGEAGVYRLTVHGNAQSARSILEGLGCRVTAVPYPPE